MQQQPMSQMNNTSTYKNSAGTPTKPQPAKSNLWSNSPVNISLDLSPGVNREKVVQPSMNELQVSSQPQQVMMVQQPNMVPYMMQPNMGMVPGQMPNMGMMAQPMNVQNMNNLNSSMGQMNMNTMNNIMGMKMAPSQNGASKLGMGVLSTGNMGMSSSMGMMQQPSVMTQSQGFGSFQW